MQKDRENTTRRRSRLAGEEALEPSSALVDAFAGKPAPTTLCLAVWDSVGAGLPAKRPSSLARPCGRLRWQASSYSGGALFRRRWRRTSRSRNSPGRCPVRG
ncbi:hypothetical protein EAG75_21135 [Pseudomonas protegens]|nr:hypothetical protein EAG75_21135 [Pseudomonas protegens]